MNSLLAAHAGRWLGIVLAVALLALPGVAAADPPADPPAEPTFTFAGGGYGHGTGMSQYGAQGQALAGHTWQEILATYFTGIGFASLRAEPVAGEIGDEGPLWVGLDQNLTHQDIKLVPLSADPHYVRVTRGADQVDVFAGANVTLSFDFTPAGCTFSVIGLEWPAGPCDFTLEWDGWTENPTVALDTTLIDDDYRSCDQPGERCYSRGTMLIRPNAAAGAAVTGFHLVVLIDMEDYLYGLLEVPYSWDPQALQAQAVAGRSYAANKQALRGSPEGSTLRQELCWCEVYDSTVDQYYAGWGRGDSAWLDAVDATAGLVISHPDVVAPSFHVRAGEPISVPTFYSSSTFGHTEDSGVAFGSRTTPSYLVGVPDPWSGRQESGNPLATWEKVITRRDLARMVGLDTVDEATIISWLRPGTEHQSAYQITFSGTNGGEPATRTRYARQLRSQLGLLSMQITSVEKFVPDGWIDTGGGGGEPDQVGMLDPTTGIWHLRDANGIVREGFYYGIPGDSPIVCDWDGLDGVSTVGLYRSTSGFMYLRDSNEFGVAENDFFFGISEDLPNCGDWDGNGTETIGIFRPSNRTFYITNTNQTKYADQETILEAPGSVPLAGDWNGDGYDTVGLYDPVSRTVSLTNSFTNPTIAISYAYNTIPEDKIITGDWDGDGRDTVGVFRPEDMAFYLRDDFVMQFSNHTIDFSGEPHWTPVAGVWDAG